MVFVYKLFSIEKYVFIPIHFLNKFNFHNYINFYLNVDLSNSNGVIFFIDKNSFISNDLLILKNVIIRLYQENKLFSILGLPYCLLQKILTPLYYTFFKPHFLSLNYNFYQYYNLSNLYSSQLISCKFCLKYNSCSGLGIIKKNLNRNEFRLHPNYRYLEKKKIIFKDFRVNNSYLNFLNHMKSSNLEFTDRTLKYAIVYSNKSNLFYSNRFVYYSRYLYKNEFDHEFKFLTSNIKNISFFKKNIQKDFYNFKAHSLAYSMAILENDVFRESFYVYYKDISGFEGFKQRYNLNFDISNFEEYYDTCIDFNNLSISGFKIYTKIKDIEKFLIFLENTYSFVFPKNLIKGSFNFSFVKRYDKNSNLIGIKFEFANYDIDLVKDTLSKLYSFKFKTQNDLFEDVFAIDLDLNGNLNKITIYYANLFSFIS